MAQVPVVVKLLSPADVNKHIVDGMLAEVKEAFNEMLIANFDGKCARINITALKELMTSKLQAVNVSTDRVDEYIKQVHIYSSYGWRVGAVPDTDTIYFEV